jgi:phosphoribosylanthranilate isomerase
MAATRIKICGITTLDDARCAVAAGADALGFVFYTKSPRYITAEAASEIIAALPPFVTTVGLFVNMAGRDIEKTMETARLNVVQLHGDELPKDCIIPGYPVVKAVRIKSADSLKGVDRYPVSALLLDAWNDDYYGGTGEQFDWQLAKTFTADCPVILAGGLNPDNVAAAITTVHPYAVDVSSGVEVAPGQKDHDKIYQFIQQVRQA